jgi:hypothetical protein
MGGRHVHLGYLPLLEKLRLVAKNNAIKIKNGTSCCGNHGEPEEGLNAADSLQYGQLTACVCVRLRPQRISHARGSTIRPCIVVPPRTRYVATFIELDPALFDRGVHRGEGGHGRGGPRADPS